MPVNVGVPVIAPADAEIDAQSGKSEAYQDTGVPERTWGVDVKDSPTFAVNAWDWTSCMVVIDVPPPPPPPPAEITSDTLVAALVPPGPVAVTENVVVPAAVGVPAIIPLEEFVAAQLGRPLNAKDAAGRFAELVRATAAEKAVPTVPFNV